MTQPGCKKALKIQVSRMRKDLREAGLTTVRAVAQASGVSKSGVDRIYNLEHFPTLDTLLALANAANTFLAFWLEPDDDEHLQQILDNDDEQSEQPEDEDGGDGEPESGEPEQAESEPEQSESEPAQSGADRMAELAEQAEAEPEPHEDGELSLLDILQGMRPTE